MKPEKIKIGDKELPIRIDYNVIEAIEEYFDTLEKFQMALIGFDWKRKEDGSYDYDEAGKPQAIVTKPSMKALKLILPLMVNEGLRYEAIKNNTEYEPMDDDLITMECEIDRMYLIEIIQKELNRCQSVKKPIPGENGKSRKR